MSHREKWANTLIHHDSSDLTVTVKVRVEREFGKQRMRDKGKTLLSFFLSLPHTLLTIYQ